MESKRRSVKPLRGLALPVFVVTSTQAANDAVYAGDDGYVREYVDDLQGGHDSELPLMGGGDSEQAGAQA